MTRHKANESTLCFPVKLQSLFRSCSVHQVECGKIAAIIKQWNSWCTSLHLLVTVQN